MSNLPPSLRKAAVLISSLDEAVADAILRQMSDEDAAKVRSALMELNDIAAEEQDSVLAAFFQQQRGAGNGQAATDDVSLELDPNVEAAAVSAQQASAQPRPLAAEKPTFDFLQDIEPKVLAGVLSRELPQTVAVVVAHLPPEQAAAVLEQLPAALATDALERIAWLDDLSLEIQADLIHELRRQLAPYIKTAKASSNSLAHLTAVLHAMDFRQRQRVVLQLGERNASLLNRLGLTATEIGQSKKPSGVMDMRYRIVSSSAMHEEATNKTAKRNQIDESAWLSFDDLSQLDDAALRAVFAAAETDIALLALTGADQRLVARILRKLNSQEAAALRHKLEHPGPLRLREVEQARTALAAVASRLAHEGKIALPSSVRFAAAV
jgi:flagellar motor switch protein FliG